MQERFFKSAAELRRWLSTNHGKATELWIGFHKAGGASGRLTYRQALDEALCFGWIDGVIRPLDKARYARRFTPRRSGSIWSLVNVKRATELVKLGLMQPPGQRAFSARDAKKTGVYSFENRPRKLDRASAAALRANAAARAFFRAQAPWYQRGAIYWVMSAKKEETRGRRLAALIRDSAQGRRVGVLNLKKSADKGPS